MKIPDANRGCQLLAVLACHSRPSAIDLFDRSARSSLTGLAERCVATRVQSPRSSPMGLAGRCVAARVVAFLRGRRGSPLTLRICPRKGATSATKAPVRRALCNNAGGNRQGSAH